MVWFDFEIPKSFIVENSKSSINFNTRCVKNVTLLEAGSICDIIKQASENRPNKSRRTSGSKAVAMRTC